MKKLIIIKQGDSYTMTETITFLDSLEGYTAKLYIVDSAGAEVDTKTGTINGLIITYEIFNEDSKSYPIGIYDFETKLFDNEDHVYTPTTGKFVVEEAIEEDPSSGFIQEPPRNLTLTLITGGVQVDWDDIAGQSFEVFSSVDNITFNKAAFLPAGIHTYRDYIDGGLTMYYMVRSTDGTNFSDFSTTEKIDVPNTDAINFIAKATAEGETPTAEQIINIHTLYSALKSAGIYDKHDAMVISSQAGRATSRLNLKNQFTEADVWTSKYTGRVAPYYDQVFYSITELSNGDLLAGAGSNDGHYYRSTDRGETWVDQGQINANVSAVYDFCDLGGGIVLCAGSVQARIGRSTDYGHTWTFTGVLFELHYLNILSYLGNGIVICCSEKSPSPYVSTVLRSTDYGVSWSSMGNALTDITVMNAQIYLGNGIVIIGGGTDTGSGIFEPGGATIIRSTNYGLTWSDVSPETEYENRYFGSCYLGNGIVLMGSANYAKIMRSEDYGATWEELTIPAASGQKVITSFVNYGDGKVIASTGIDPANGLILRSDDWGKIWENMGIALTGQNISHLCRLSEGTLLAAGSTNGTTPAQIFKSTTNFFARITANTLNLTEVANGGTLTFTTKLGFNSDGASYINSKYRPNVGMRWKLDNCCFWYLISGTRETTGFRSMGGQGAGTAICCIGNNEGTGQGVIYINDANTTGQSLCLIGYNGASRIGEIYEQFVNENKYTLTGAPGVAACENELFLLAYNEYPNPNYWMGNNIRLVAYGIASGLTQGEFITMQGIINAFRAAL